MADYLRVFSWELRKHSLWTVRSLLMLGLSARSPWLQRITMDDWDPAVTDGLARDREVILFNNAGIPQIS